MVKSVVLAWGSLGVGSPRSANRRQIRGQWAAAADRVLPRFGRRTPDARDRRNLWRALQDLFGAERARQPRCGDGESSPAARECRRCARSALSSPLPAGKATSRCNAIRRLSRRSAPGPSRIGYDAAIWTALASNFDDWGKGGEPFSVSAALQYLETLERDDPAKFAQALAYIRNAPPEVETPVREDAARRWPLSDGTAARFSPVAKAYPSGTPTLRIIS